MKEKIWTTTYPVSTFLVDPQKKLGLYSLLNLVQDTAWEHATHLGHGYESMLKKGVIWILTRQKLRMDAWPSWGETIQLKTWIRPIQGAFATRDFEFYVDQKKIGECTTCWLTMTASTRKPARISMDEEDFEARTDYQLSIEPPRVKSLELETTQTLKTIQVRNSDLDMNEHVNNTRYAQWILDSIPLDWHRKFTIKDYEANFLAETKAGDVIQIQTERSFPEIKSEDRSIPFQGLRTDDQKVAFTAKLWI